MSWPHACMTPHVLPLHSRAPWTRTAHPPPRSPGARPCRHEGPPRGQVCRPAARRRRRSWPRPFGPRAPATCRCSATSPAVRTSRFPSSGCWWMSRRHAMTLRFEARGKLIDFGRQLLGLGQRSHAGEKKADECFCHGFAPLELRVVRLYMPAPLSGTHSPRRTRGADPRTVTKRNLPHVGFPIRRFASYLLRSTAFALRPRSRFRQSSSTLDSCAHRQRFAKPARFAAAGRANPITTARARRGSMPAVGRKQTHL